MAKKFIRKDTHKKKRLATTWRAPKGITNKKRLNRKGHSPNVRPGYGTKASDRGKNKDGLMIIQVATMDELKKINPKTQAALLAGVGKKRKIELLTEAEKLKITLVNFNSKSYKLRVEKFLSEKKNDATQRKDDAKKEQDEKVTKEKTSEDKNKEEINPEDKKKIEKEERDKVLTKSK
ncbi:MAG: eL32 family ribosomal protein [Candidatus Woesearchaeota archaeon]|jgi:large subunit ribosomal protein L32e